MESEFLVPAGFGILIVLALVYCIYALSLGKKRFRAAVEIVKRDSPEIQVDGNHFSKKGWRALFRRISGKEETYTKNSSPVQIRVEFELDVKVPLFSVRPKGRAKAFLKRSRGPELKTGADDFDRKYVVSGVSEDFARDFLDPATRELIHNLRMLRQAGIINFEAFGRTASVTFLDFIPSVTQLADFLKGSFAFADRLVSLASKLQEGEGGISAGPDENACPVCGDALAQKTVQCSKCGKAHHRDCWTYWGMCTAPDCGETKPK